MIEKLYPEDYPFGEPEYSDYERQIEMALAELRLHLSDRGLTILEQMDRFYHAQCETAVRDAFTVGFHSAIDLLIEVHESRLS